MQHNEPSGGIRGMFTWNDLSFEDGGCVCVISFNSIFNTVVPMGALKKVSRSKRRHGS
jgi:hypothetical protein